MTNPKVFDIRPIPCVFKRGKSEINGQIVSATWSRVQDGDDFCVGSVRHLRTGLPDGRIIRGWQIGLNCDVIVEPCEDLCTYNLFVDDKEYVVNETITDSRNKSLVRISAARYEEAHKIIHYHD